MSTRLPSRRISRQTRDATIGLIGLIVSLLLIVGMLTGDLKSLFSSGPGRTIIATFSSTQQLRTGAPVDLDGIDVGEVRHISLLRGGRAARVRMSVEASAGPLYGDASASLRWRTLLGGAFKISLTRGNPTAGPLGPAGIPASRTSDQIELEDLTSLVQGPAKSGLQTMPRELARALQNPAALANDVNLLAAVAPSVRNGVGAVRGSVPDTDLQNLISTAAQTVSALDLPHQAVRTLVSAAASVVQTTDEHSGAVMHTLASAPGTFTAIKTTFAQLNDTLREANPLIAHLQAPARQVAPTVIRLRPTVLGADRLLRSARPLLADLRPALLSLANTSTQALPLVNEIAPSLTRLNSIILPYMNQIDPETEHSAAEMVGPAMEGLGPAMNGGEDDNGHIVRFPATIGSESAYLPCQTTFGNPDDHGALLQCESLQDALTALSDYTPTSLTGTQP